MARPKKEDQTKSMWLVTGCIIVLLVTFFLLGYAMGKTDATIDTIKNISETTDSE